MSDIFYAKARKCKLCGRLVFSEKALETGYGCFCQKKVNDKIKQESALKGQMTIMDWLQGEYGQKIKGSKA